MATENNDQKNVADELVNRRNELPEDPSPQGQAAGGIAVGASVENIGNTSDDKKYVTPYRGGHSSSMTGDPYVDEGPGNDKWYDF